MESDKDLSLSVVPYRPKEIPKNLDLKTPPPNWLRSRVVNVTGIGKKAVL